MSKEQFLQVVNNTLPDIKQELTVTTLAELGYPQLLHISTNPSIAVFTPIVPPRASDAQDHRLPRICTATGLAGCIIGYNGLSYDHLDRNWNDKSYLGGYVIYSFKPDVVVTPSKALLADQHITDEQWMVSYNPETVNYKPTIIGKMFMSEYVVTRNETKTDESESGKSCDYKYVLFVEVNEGEVVHWNRSTVLKSGYYRIVVTNIMDSESCDKLNYNDVRSVDKAEYLHAKGITASMLSFPLSLRW